MADLSALADIVKNQGQATPSPTVNSSGTSTSSNYTLGTNGITDQNGNAPYAPVPDWFKQNSLQIANNVVNGSYNSATGTFQSNVPSPSAPSSTNLSGTYANVNGTIYNKNTGQAFSTPQQFFTDSGVNSFNGVNFDTQWKPPQQMQTATQNTQPAYSGNTYGFGNGSVYGQQGQQLSSPVVAQETQPAQDISATIPNNITPSSALGNSPTNGDIQGAFQKNLDALDMMISQLGNLGQVSPEEQNLQNQVAGEQGQITGLNLQSQGRYNPDNQAIAMPFLTGQAQNKLVSAQLQNSVDQARLAYMQGNRQFAFNSMSTVYNAARQNLMDTLSVYTQSAPQNIATNYNPSTGMLNAVMRNPITGAQYTANLGNIGAQKSYVNISSPVLDPNTGQYFVSAFKADGTSEVIPITGQGAGQPQSGGFSSGNQGSQGFNSSPTGLTTPAAVNNNPGNLRDPKTGQWQQFSTPQAGFQALMSDIQGKQTGNTRTGLNGNSTLSQFTSVYAPASDGNDPAGYASTIAKQLGVSTNTPIGQIPTASLAAAVAQHEDGKYWAAITTGNTSPATNVAPVVQKYMETLPNVANSEYVNSNRIPGNLTDAIKNMAGGVVPVLTDPEVGTIKSISTTAENLETMRQLSNELLGSGIGRVGSTIRNAFTNITQIGNSDVAKFNTFREAAIKTIQGLASGSSGLQINESEINSAVQNMPTIYDNKEFANAKLDQVEAFLQNSISKILPHAQLQTSAPVNPSTGQVDYTKTLNDILASYGGTQ